METKEASSVKVSFVQQVRIDSVIVPVGKALYLLGANQFVKGCVEISAFL